MRRYKRKPILDRFKSFYMKDANGCWIWNGRKSNGYGQMKVNGKSVRAHRLSYELFKGDIPAGLFVCHRCDVRSCVNPDHLFLGTGYDNVQDMIQKDRFSRGESHYNSKISDVHVMIIREAWDVFGRGSQAKMAKYFKVDPVTITQIITKTNRKLVRVPV